MRDMLKVALTHNQKEIGEIHISLASQDDPEDGELCLFSWFANLEGRPAQSSSGEGASQRLVEHPYGVGGEWALVSKVIDKAGYGTTE